jgi:hypothetical protein
VSTRVLSLNKLFLNIHKNRYEKQGQNPPILVYHITYYVLLGSKLKLHSVLYIDSKKLISTKSEISAILLFGLNIFVMVEASINSTGCQREQFSSEGVYWDFLMMQSSRNSSTSQLETHSSVVGGLGWQLAQAIVFTQS